MSASLAELADALRGSVVGVMAGPRVGSGFVALANGIIATTQRIAGFDAEVQIEIEGGQRLPARVIAVSVRRDVALVLPRETLGIPALRPSAAAVRPGDPVVALRRMPGLGFGVMTAIATACDAVVDGVPHVETDAATAAASAGGPVVDLEGKLVGLAGVVPIVARDRAGLVLPYRALAEELEAVQAAAAALADRVPAYRCPRCDQAFTAELDRCLGCGALLPHAAEAGAVGDATSARVVRDILSTVGIVANKVRTGPGDYRVLMRAPGVDEATAIGVRVDERRGYVTFRAPVVRAPASRLEPFFRLLATANDATTGAYRLELDGDIVYLSFAEPIALVRERDAAEMLHALCRLAEHFRVKIASPYGVDPLFEGPLGGA